MTNVAKAKSQDFEQFHACVKVAVWSQPRAVVHQASVGWSQSRRLHVAFVTRAWPRLKATESLNALNQLRCVHHPKNKLNASQFKPFKIGT